MTDDRNVLGRGVALDAGRQLVPVHSGHHDVQQNQIGRLPRGEGEKAFLPEDHLQQLSVVALIVHNQHARLVIGVLSVRIHTRASCVVMVARNSWYRIGLAM